MLIFSYILGLIFVVALLGAGLILKYYPPAYNNKWYGMKTRHTARTEKTWIFSHKVCANILLTIFPIALLCLVFFVLVFNDFFTKFYYLIIVLGFVLSILGVLITYFITNHEAKKYYNKK